MPPEIQQAPPPGMITGIINPQGERATLPEEYFRFQTKAGVPITYQGPATYPRAPTGSEYKYYTQHKGGAGWYTSPSPTAIRGEDPWASRPAIDPEIARQLSNIAEAGKAREQQQIYQVHEFGKSTFSGSFTDYGMRMAGSPIGTPIPTEKQYEQLKYLQSPTAQYPSSEAFQRTAAGLEKYAPFANVTEFRGTVATSIPVPPPTQQGAYNYESPFGKGIIKPENFPGKYPDRQYPTTPLHERTDISQLTSYPLYKGAAAVSRGLTGAAEWGIDILPAPVPLKEAGKGFTGVFTSLPEYFASGISGLELAAREPKMFTGSIIPAFGMFGGNVAQQAQERPLYTIGQVGGLLTLGKVFSGKPAKGIEVSKPVAGPSEPGIFSKMFGSRQVPAEGVTAGEFKSTITPSVSKMFGETPKIIEGVGDAKPSIIPSFGKLFGERKLPATGATIEEFKTGITPTVGKMFGTRQAPAEGATMGQVRAGLTPTVGKMFGEGKVIIPEQKLITWNLFPTREYVWAKFQDYNIFRKGDIEQISKTLKAQPTAPVYPPQIRPMGFQRPIMPKQVTPETPVKGIKISEVKPAPSPKGTEIIMKSGQVLIQRQKVIPKVEVIQAPKVKAGVIDTLFKSAMFAPVVGVPAFRPLTAPMTEQKPQVSPITKFQIVQKLKIEPISIPVSSQVPSMSTEYTPIVTQRSMQLALITPVVSTKTVADTVQEIQPIAIQKTISPQIQLPKQLERPKLMMDVPWLFKKKRRKGKPFKYPEIARVATPKQVRMGLNLSKLRFKL